MTYQSSKNKLQEILQKRGEAPPTYTAVASNGEFRATVTLPDGRSFTGEPMTRKKHAEILAAAVAIPHVVPTPTRIDATACVFIDVENVPTALDALRTQVDVPGVKVFGFHSLNTTVDTTGLPDNFEIVKVPSAHRDAADVGILIYLGSWMTKLEFNSIAIVTKDHFAHAAAECVAAWSTKDMHVCRDAQGVIEWLQSI